MNNNIYLNEEFNIFWKKIENNENFTLLRYGDGERAIMCGKKVKAQEGWESPNHLSKLGQALLSTLNIQDKKIYHGISCPCCDSEAYFWYKSRIENKNITFANLWVNANYKNFIEKFSNLKRDAILIANHNADKNNFENLNILKHYKIGDDCINFWENEAGKLISEIKNDFGDKNDLFYVVSAGPLSEPIIVELFKNNPNNCYIDFGSSIDKFIHKTITRPYMNDKTSYANQNCYMHNPNTNMDVSVILTLYKRPQYLEEQLRAMQNQSLKPKEILLYQDGTSDTIKIPENIKQEFDLIEISPINKGVWERFNFARKNAKSLYVCILDDDTIPASRWLENCMDEMLKKEGLYGGIGIIAENEKYDNLNHKRTGWANKNQETTMVDFVGHSWFLKKDWLEWLFEDTQELQNYKICAEDMTLSMKLQQHGISSYIPMQPENIPEFCSSINGSKFGSDEQSLFVNNGWAKMSEAFDKLINDYGFETIEKRDKKLYKKIIKKLKNKKPSLLEEIFSIKNSQDKKHKITTLLGIKIKIKQQQ